MDVPEIAFQKILYTTDLTATSRHAFTYAASLAHRYGATLTVLHVVDEEPELDRRLAGYIKEDLWEEIKTRDMQEAKRILLDRKRDNTAILRECVGQYCEEIQVGSPAAAYVSYDITIRLGEPVDEILAYADSGGFDLLVVGHHGQPPLKQVILGDTAGKVLQHAKIPVLVVPLPQ